MQKRQPKGVPVGGEFASNSHQEADADLCETDVFMTPGAEVNLPPGWSPETEDVSAGLFHPNGYDAIVRAPSGDLYGVGRRHHGVRVETMSSANAEWYADVDEHVGVDRAMSGDFALRYVYIGRDDDPGVANPDERAQVKRLAAQSIARLPESRTREPFASKWSRPGDVVDITDILRHTGTVRDNNDDSEIAYLRRAVDTTSDGGTIFRADHDHGLTTIHFVGGARLTLPEDFLIQVNRIDDRYEHDPEVRFS